ncbi:MAG: AAA family ATPase [Candidatus Babeliales bacterium]
MIPIRLEIENFLSYGKRQIIEFAGYPLICLSGKNGHGKSALLDAMTWAIWGQARKTAGASKPDDNLLRIGQTFMTVIFEFEFNTHTYRIKREYAKTYAKPYASLDFGIYDTSSKTIRALTDKTIRATQEKIIATIGLDYDTFINSAFLRQGSSNEFSKKSAKERKQILSAILGLNQFEALKQRALYKAKDLGNQKKYSVEHSQKVKVQLERLNEVIALAQVVGDRLQVLSTTTEHYELTQKKIAQTKQELTAKIEQRNILLKQEEELLLRKSREEEQLNALWQQWHRVHSAQHTGSQKNELEAKRTLMNAAIAQHQTALEKQLGFKEQTLQLKEQFALVLQQLKVQHDKELHTQQLNAAHQEMLVKETSTKLAILTATQEQTNKHIAHTLKEITQGKIDLERLEKSIAAQEKLRPRFEKKKNYYHAWVAQAQQLIKEQTDLTQKKQLSLEQDDPSCPLCEQNLSLSRKRFIHTKLMHREQFISARLHRLKTILTPLKQTLLAEHAHFEEAQKLAHELERQRVHICHIQKEHEALLKLTQENEKQHALLAKELSAINAALTKTYAQLKELTTTQEKMLSEHQPLQLITQQLDKLEIKSKELGYNAEQHQRDKKNIEEIETKLLQYASLEQARKEQTDRKQACLALFASLKTIKRQLKEVSEQCKQLQPALESMQKLTVDEKELLAAFTTLQKEKESLSREQGSLEHERKQLELMAKELEEEQKRITMLDAGSFEYGAIATALGKDGIQALLIEETIPEIEQETNALLGALTDNQAHIMIESLKDLKKGGAKETLDINISDTQGIRPYEMFSGGEAFRIDFALRIAISKLLARRAGTSLQTLIIDEGFGSQDDEGLHRLMEAIYAIQDNFCKIIIVSHLPSMKEQFPVHFIVDKGPQGSTVTILEQG